MSDGPNLFDYSERFPNAPGFKRGGTSKAAAAAIKPRAPTLRDQVLTLLQGADMTADECATALAKTPFSIRPRLTELMRLGKIYESGLTRKNESGVSAIVWRAF